MTTERQIPMFYYKEQAEDMISEARKIYFLLGAGVGALLMFAGLVSIGIWFGV